MAVHLSHTTINAVDPARVAAFWSKFAGWSRQGESTPSEVYLLDDNGFTVLFIEVPDAKTTPNRIHLDLRPVDATRNQEVQRAATLGATVVADRSSTLGWVVMADREGNEFCILGE